MITPLQVEWKLARGTWRPRLLDFAKQQDAGNVRAASERALSHLRASSAADVQGAVVSLKAALAELTTLKVT